MAPDGYSRFSIETVARQADVARMTVYHQFGSKLGLLEALCDSLAASGGMEQIAIVENWRSDERLASIWMEMMEGFATAATYRIERDRARGRAPLTDVDAHTLASTLTWMSKRVYYLAAIGHPAFHNEQQVIDVLTDIWLSAIYQRPSSKKTP